MHGVTGRNGKGGVGRVFWAAALVAVAALVSGCKSGLGTYNVKLQLDEQLKAASSVPSIEVDMIALGGAESQRLQSKPVRQYFAAGDADRQSFRDQDRLATRTFSSGNTMDKVLEAKDPIWRSATWKTAPDLVLLSNVPGAQNDMDRRLVLPRDRAMWPKGTKDIVVRVRADRLELITQPVSSAN